jgi:hypothetical protein
VPPTARRRPTTDPDTDTTGAPAAPAALPAWFGDFLASRGSSKKSPHTMIAWRQDVTAIATLITAGHPKLLAPADITRRSLQQAFSTYAATRAHPRRHCHVRCVSVTWEGRSGEYRNAVVQGLST